MPYDQLHKVQNGNVGSQHSRMIAPRAARSHLNRIATDARRLLRTSGLQECTCKRTDWGYARPCQTAEMEILVETKKEIPAQLVRRRP